MQIRPCRRNRCRSLRYIGEISVIHKKRASKWGIGDACGLGTDQVELDVKAELRAYLLKLAIAAAVAIVALNAALTYAIVRLTVA